MPSFWIIGLILLAVVVALRLLLRLSSQWRMLKKEWTWKDELMDILFYFVFLCIALGLVKIAGEFLL